MTQAPQVDLYRHVDWDKVASVRPVIHELSANGAKKHGSRELLVCDDDRLTYAEAESCSRFLALRLLQYGVGKGSRVGILLPNSPEFVVTWLAVVRIGGVAVPLSTLSTGTELANICKDAGFSLLIATDSFLSANFIERIRDAFALSEGTGNIATNAAPHLKEVWLWRGTASWASPIELGTLSSENAERVAIAEQQVAPADPVTIIYTSGSTAAPKGVLHSHGAFVRSSRRWAASMVFEEGDRHFSVSPMFWVGGLITSLLTMMQVGATLVNSFTHKGSVLDIVERERCTSLQVWPHLARKLIEDPTLSVRDLRDMRAGTIYNHLPQAAGSNPKPPFAYAMGMTETAGPHTLAMGELNDIPEGGMGLLAPGMEHKIVDPDTKQLLADGDRGELYVRGDSLMIGYVGKEREEVFDADGWFPTGDLCSIKDKYIFFHGRIDSVFKTAGANVSPAEVESILLSIPGVAEAYVVGVPDDERGLVVGALVVPRNGAALTREGVIEQSRRHLSPFKVPRRLLLCDSIPLTPTNKFDRRAASAWLSEKG